MIDLNQQIQDLVFQYLPTVNGAALAAELCDALATARAEERERCIRDFATSILHGDEAHRTWLLNEAELYIKAAALRAMEDDNG